MFLGGKEMRAGSLFLVCYREASVWVAVEQCAIMRVPKVVPSVLHFTMCLVVWGKVGA